jgi:hypothetical protein
MEPVMFEKFLTKTTKNNIKNTYPELYDLKKDREMFETVYSIRYYEGVIDNFNTDDKKFSNTFILEITKDNIVNLFFIKMMIIILHIFNLKV